MATLEALFGIGAEDDATTQARIRQLRGQQQLGDFLALSTVPQIAQQGQTIGKRVNAAALAGGRRRKEALDRLRQAKRDEVADQQWSAEQGLREAANRRAAAAAEREAELHPGEMDKQEQDARHADAEEARRAAAFEAKQSGVDADVFTLVDPNNPTHTKTYLRRSSDGAFIDPSTREVVRPDLENLEPLERYENRRRWEKEQETDRISAEARKAIAEAKLQGTDPTKVKMPTSIASKVGKIDGMMRRAYKAYNQLVDNPGAYHGLKDTGIAVAGKLWGPIGEGAKSAGTRLAYTKEQRKARAAIHKLANEIRHALTGAQLTKYEIGDNVAWMPGAPGVGYEDSVSRLGLLIQAMNDDRDSFAGNFQSSLVRPPTWAEFTSEGEADISGGGGDEWEEFEGAGGVRKRINMNDRVQVYQDGEWVDQ